MLYVHCDGPPADCFGLDVKYVENSLYVGVTKSLDIASCSAGAVSVSVDGSSD